MENTRASKQTVLNVPQSSYFQVGRQIAALISRLNLHESRSQIMQTYKDICSDSLAFPYGIHPPGYSRINHDGTPIQYAVTVGGGHHTLQFLGEAGGPDIIGAERMRVNRDCIATVAQRLHMNEALSSVTHLFDMLAPETNIDLLADPGGAYWLGVAFSAEREPSLRIYINARWGKELERWARLDRFAGYFDESLQWRNVAATLAPDLQPLGAAITLNGDKFPSGRIYLSAYGKCMSFYEKLTEVYGNSNLMNQVRLFGKCVLGDNYPYPTQTAVCSFGFGENPRLDFKFELCAHCVFTNDVEASDRLRSWFEAANLDATDYWDVLDILSEGYLSHEATDLHCYVGLGMRRDTLYGTIYFKPRLFAI